MGRLISIVATPPRRVAANAVPLDGDPAIIAVTAVLAATRETNPNHSLDRATSVRELARILKSRRPTPEDVVQIVGHGTPGILALGRAWTQDYKGDEGVYCLDSNPFTYDLLDHLVPPGCVVLLVGCSVGEDRGKLPNDGATLMFDLSRLWSTTVAGVVGYVGPDDFDPTGKFIDAPAGLPPGMTRLVVARDRTVSTAVVPPPVTDNSTPITLPAVSRVISMPALGRFEDEADVEKIADDALQSLNQIEIAPIVTPPSLALPEVVFALRGGGRLELLANATTIRVIEAGKPPRYYAPANQTDVGSLVGGVGGMVTAALQ